MRHTIISEGFGVRLRPVKMEDAPFIVWLRSRDHALGRVGDSATDVAAQQAWLANYFERAGDYYFLIETPGGIPTGTYGLWDPHEESAESGRWITRTDVPVAIPSAILGLDVAFGPLNLKRVRVKTVSTNTPVLSLNRKFGMRETHVEKNSQLIGGKMVDQIHFILEPADWTRARQKLLPMAAIAQKQVQEWERSKPPGFDAQ